jgi:hypothetical protein
MNRTTESSPLKGSSTCTVKPSLSGEMTYTGGAGVFRGSTFRGQGVPQYVYEGRGKPGYLSVLPTEPPPDTSVLYYCAPAIHPVLLVIVPPASIWLPSS